MSEMRVSVLIGTRNRVEPLRRCLRSLRTQTLRPHEILVLDDASDEVNVLAALADFPEARVIRAERQLGVGPGRNRLMREASGDVFVILDDDAYLADPDGLERLRAAFVREPRVAIVATRIVEPEGDGQRFRVPFSARVRRTLPALLETTRRVSYYLGGGHAIRRAVYDVVGGYDERFVWGEEELELSYRVIEAGHEILYAADVVVVHEPVPAVLRTATRPQSELFHHVRNRIVLAWKYLPFRYALPYLGIWMSRHAGTAARRGQLGEFAGGVIDGLRSLTPDSRTPLSAEARSYLRRNYGRLWF